MWIAWWHIEALVLDGVVAEVCLQCLLNGIRGKELLLQVILSSAGTGLGGGGMPCPGDAP